MADRTEPRVAVVGAGLAGCLLATLLGRRGIPVTVYERRPDPRLAGAERGRSINLAISARGLAALEQVGLREDALARALPMRGRMVHGTDGSQSLRPYSADGTRAINSISRAELNHALLDVAAKTPGVSIEFGYRLRELDLQTGRLSFDTEEGRRRRRADLVFGADGSYSAARRAVTFRPGFTFSQDYLAHEYKELTIPARSGSGHPPANVAGGPPGSEDGGAAGVATGAEFALDPGALHIWPRGSSMMIALPNLDGSFTCTLFWPHAEFDALRTDEQIRDYFARHYPDVADLMPTLVEDYRLNPLGSLVTVRCTPWVHRGAECTLALVGDAAHAIVPFFGQGANCAFEDCVELIRCLDEHDGDWTAALAGYEQRRKPNCDAIAEMALDNFVEMRDRVNDPVFRVRTAAQHALERRLPGHYVSRYELVSFSTMPYAQIPERMRRQNRATAAVAGGVLAIAAAAVGRRSGRRR